MAKNNSRESRGRELAAKVRIERVGSRWRVPSQSSAAVYLVDIEEESCTCPDYELTQRPCKHVHCVYFAIARGRVGAANEEAPVTKEPAPTAPRKTYGQPWTKYNLSQVHERELFEQLLRDLCAGIQQPPRRDGSGRPRRLLRATAFAAIMKTYLGFSNRRVQSDLRACSERGRLDEVRHFNSISTFLGDEATTPLLERLVEESAAPLHLIEDGRYAIDASGVSTVTYDRWYDHRYGEVRAKHPWIKLHVVVGTSTHGVVAAKVSPEGDCPVLPELVGRAKEKCEISELSADKAYSSEKNYEVLEQFGITPYIPFKVNAKMHERSDAWSRYLGVFLFDRERFMSHYHARSNVETAFSMIKRKFGSSVTSRRATAQANETLTKVIAHNLCAVTKAMFVAGLAPQLSAAKPLLVPEPAERVRAARVFGRRQHRRVDALRRRGR